MEALKRTPKLDVKREMTLADGTKLAVKGIPAGELIKLQNNKSMSDTDKGMHRAAAKLLVNGQPIVYDDLMNCFTDDELEEILMFVVGGDEKNG